MSAILYKLTGLSQLIYFSFGSWWIILIENVQLLFCCCLFNFSKESLKTIKHPLLFLSDALPRFLGSFSPFCVVYCILVIMV